MPKIPPHQRPSLEDMANKNGQPNGWVCPRCGCVDWRVSTTRFIDPKKYGIGPKIRARFCRNCKHPMTTMELPVPEGHTLRVVKLPKKKEEDSIPVIEEEDDEEDIA